MRTILALTLLAGCGFRDARSEYNEDILPREEKIAVNLPTGSAAKDETSGELARFYASTRAVTEHVNGRIRFVLGTVAYVTTLQPQWADSDTRRAVWGPYSDSGLDPVEIGLYVQEEDDGSYGWAIFYLPRGGDIEVDAVPVVAGVVDAGATSDVASGEFVIDYATAASMDPAIGETGLWSVEYAYDEAGVAAVVLVDDYGSAYGDGSVDAAYAYEQTFDGAGTMDLAWMEDVDGRGTEELAALRTRWEATGSGRSDAVVIGGDLSVEAAYATECWGTDFVTSYWTDSVGMQEQTGDVGACAFAEQELPSETSFSSAD